MVRLRLLRLFSGCCLVVTIAGCERQPIIVETVVPKSQLCLMKINVAYNNYVDRFGRAPRDENELLPMLAAEKSEEDAPEVLLTSSKGYHFVICYGIDPMTDLSWANSTPVLAYEQEVGEGKRWVLTAIGSILRMPEAEFRKASFPPGHEPVFENDAGSTP